MLDGKLVVEVGIERKAKFKSKCTKLSSDMTKQIIAFIDKFLAKGKK